MCKSDSFHVVLCVISVLTKAVYTIQDCILPQHPANGKFEPTDSDCPSHKFNSSACQGVPGVSVTDGWFLYLRCNEGFVSDSEKHSQSQITCADGRWLPPLPSCVYNFTNDHYKCTAPSYPENGKYKPLPIECALNYKSSESLISPGTFLPSLCVLVYHCNPGYELDDQETISVCIKGQWNPKRITCKSINEMGSTFINRDDNNRFKNNDKSCTLPNPAENRQFSNYSCGNCAKRPGDYVSHSDIISVTCSPGHYMLQGVDSVSSNALTTCHNGNWSPKIPQCYKLCPPLKSLTVDLECWNGLSLVSCKKPALPGTIVKYSCKEYFESNKQQQSPNLRCDSGEWSGNLPLCKPKCGLANSKTLKIQPSIVGGEIAKAAGIFPWHAGLYHNKSNRWEAVCGGTLISTRIVLTAAHCVTLPCYGCPSQPMKPQDIMVALGKIYRDWDVSEESETRIGIKEVHAQEDYVGRSLNYYHDIAILILKTHVTINKFVLPACIDFHDRYVIEVAGNKSVVGYVAGWGNTEECTPHGKVCNSPSDTLKYATTTVLSFHDCVDASQAIKRFQGISLTTDKYCAGNGSESVAQQGDSGGGHTFVFDGLHYIYGIVSIKLKLEVEDKLFYSFSAFTNVTKYMNWINSAYTTWKE